MKFKEKFVVVSGGSSGIGRQIVLDLISEGSSVAVLARNKKALDKIVNDENAHGRVFGYQCNITDAAKVDEVFDDIRKKLGNAFGLVNNAGINPSRNDILNTSVEDWNSTLNVNLTGSFNCSKAALRQMLDCLLYTSELPTNREV